MKNGALAMLECIQTKSELAYVAEPALALQRDAVLCNMEKEIGVTCLHCRASAGSAT